MAMLGFDATFSDLQPDESGLLRWLASSLTNDDRHRIAACDYGDQVEGHRAAIDEILHSGRVARRFDWVPREVLALTRWTEIDPAAPGERMLSEHRQRLFATAALMAQLPLDSMDEDASENTLFGFVDSAIVLGQQPLAMGMLRWILGGLEARVAIEAELAKSSGEEDFEPADVTGREVAYLPLAILLLDRSQERPVLSSGTVKAAVALGRTLDHPYRQPGTPLPEAAFFHEPSEGMREKGWRALLREAVSRERVREAAGQLVLDADAASTLRGWWERALATGHR